MHNFSNQDSTCDEKVYNSLFSTYSKDLYNFLYYKFGAQHNPADVVQEAYLQLWKKCKDVLPEKAKSFLFTVANNRMLNDLSRKKTATDYQKNPSISVNKESPEYLYEEAEYMHRLEDALNQLTEDQRATFLMNRVEGKKHQEIADMLGISRKTVEKRIYTSLAKLREKLGEKF